MKRKYFNVFLNFDHDSVDSIIQHTINRNDKGYVCSVESNNLTIANRDPEFLEILNNALVNICDGSVIALTLRIIHKQKYGPYIGADLFIKYIKMCKYSQYFIGNTREVLDGLKNNLSSIDPDIAEMPFKELPFKQAHEFDYQYLASLINQAKPDIIWVSLGAPKQERFMSNLLPHIEQGVMFGFGAIFNFFSGVGTVKRAPKIWRKLNLEWLFRAMNEPKKNIPRYLAFIKILPKLILKEYQTRFESNEWK